MLLQSHWWLAQIQLVTPGGPPKHAKLEVAEALSTSLAQVGPSPGGPPAGSRGPPAGSPLADRLTTFKGTSRGPLDRL